MAMAIVTFVLSLAHTTACLPLFSLLLNTALKYLLANGCMWCDASSLGAMCLHAFSCVSALLTALILSLACVSGLSLLIPVHVLVHILATVSCTTSRFEFFEISG